MQPAVAAGRLQTCPTFEIGSRIYHGGGLIDWELPDSYNYTALHLASQGSAVRMNVLLRPVFFLRCGCRRAVAGG